MAEIRIRGLGVSEGIRLVKAFKYTNSKAEISYKDIEENQVTQELARLTSAKERCLEDMDALINQVTQDLGSEKAGILKGQRSFLTDPTFCPAMEKLVATKLFSAEKSVNQVVNNFVAIFEKMPNEYMKERAADIKDVGNRMLSVLTGTRTAGIADINEEVILIVEDLAPSDTVQLNKKYIQGLMTQRGGKTSHTAIFARSMGIPAIVGIADFFDTIKTDDFLIIDGNEGLCIINPDIATKEEYTQKLEDELKSKDKLKAYTDKKASSKDGVRIEIAANIGSLADAKYALEQGAEGIGLLRTELIYMAQDVLPDEETQFNTYRDILEAMPNKAVIIRTLDIGGDKELPYLTIPKEMNPFLGYRAIRLCLDQKHLLVTQLRAILRASSYGKAKIMFPMISSLDEWRKARDVLVEVKAQLDAEGIEYDKNIELGIMVEIPSAAVLADQFAREVDFFSIGTNDLVQYTLAVDRMNEKIAYLYDHFHPAVISLIRNVSKAAHAEGKFVGMCGGMAGDPLAIPLLMALGLDELSMSAGSIQKSKHLVSQLSIEDCKEVTNKVLSCATAEEVRDRLKEFLAKYDI